MYINIFKSIFDLYLYICRMRDETRLELAKLKEDGELLLKSFPETIEVISAPRFLTTDLGLKPRWVSYWRSQEIFLNSIPDGQWYKFSLIEAVWVKLILKLRMFNFPIAQIKKIKETLTINLNANLSAEAKDIMENTIKTMSAKADQKRVADLLASEEFNEILKKFRLPMFDALIGDLVGLRNQHRLFIDAEGNVLPYKISYGSLYSEWPEFREFLSGSYLSVSLNELVSELFGEIGIDLSYTGKHLLSEDEFKVIEAMREKGVIRIEITFMSKKPTLKITKKEFVEKGMRIERLLFSEAYQDIKLITQKGRVIHCENTRKIKLNNKRTG